MKKGDGEMIKLAPSILSANFGRLEEEIIKISDGGCDYIHIDVMDGHFVPNITFGPPVIKAIRNATDKPFDVHLMIENPIIYIDDFAKSGADIITVHYEGNTHLHRLISKIKEKGIKVGIAINPATPCSAIEPILHLIDLVLIMSVDPGFGGQSFIPFSLDKIKEMKSMINKNGLNCVIQVDGGINLENVGEIVQAGADVIVAGSSIFGAEDVVKTIKAFKKF